ncbi:MAG: TIGR03960 family B12-binding radical SAM protein [Desulfobacula sp.]|nr:TIGR03960 family B12-binding radical SAM protein [Desulfobacula sp.]
MYKSEFQDTLALVQMPTRYTGNEINAVKKDLNTVDLTFALVFPDLYEIGTSHFGLQILYSILNNQKNIAAERFFAPAPDMERYLKEKQIPSLSMESKKELKTFDIIGISLLYELNFTNILTILSLSNIEFYAEERHDLFPLIIGGGPCAFNPEPLADFFDAFVIGDGEDVIVQISNLVVEFKKQGDGRKKSLLKLLSKIDGVYVPSFFEPCFDEYGIQTLTPLFEDYKKVKRAFLPELTIDNFPISPIVPFAKPVHDRLRLEIARGCSRGCRFCQAGMIYRPVRERSLDDLIQITKKSLQATGYSDVSLLSLSTGDYSNLPQLMESLLDLGKGHCNAISLPSIRAEKLTPQVMNIIKKVRKTGFTIAPEAGTQRLRDIVNKNLTKESIEASVKNAFELGWKNIKLYFMMGLPFETSEDLTAICDLSQDLATSYAKGKKNINTSVTCFIPKSHTPFQRCSQITLEETKEKLQYFKDTLRHRKVKLKWQNPEMSMVEGVWARGDRKLSKLLVTAFEKGCRLDGWNDKFDFSLWQKAFEDTGIDPEFYTSRKRNEDEALPWDIIDSGVSSKFLSQEFQKAEEKALTFDCRENECTGCGVCDFKKIKPVLHDILVKSPKDLNIGKLNIQETLNHGDKTFAQENTFIRLPDDAFKKFEISFSKLDNARFFGHLELATIVKRAVKRAGLNAKYSKGFNPSMRLSFETALPLGMESEEELLFIYLEKELEPEKIINLLNHTLPKGLFITGCRPFNKLEKKNNNKSFYTIRFSQACLAKEKVDHFLNLSEFIVEDLSKKGKIRKTDLRKSVEKISFIDLQSIEIVLKKHNDRIIRPAQILKKCFELDENHINSARIKKIKSKE